MALKILKSGIADSVQDGGRFGFQNLGINPTGVSDIVAATIANALIGNDTGAAILELHYPASTFQFTENTCIALSGADFCACIDDLPVPLNTPLIVRQNAILKFEKKSSWGCRCYLSAQGGFNVPEWLNSFSTNTNAKAGGFCGRNLKKGDELSIAFSYMSKDPLLLSCKLQADSNSKLKAQIAKHTILPWHTTPENFYRNRNIIRVVIGNEFEWLTSEYQKLIGEMRFKIGIQSNRMGYRLESESLEVTEKKQLLSTSVTHGTIQLLPNGQLIILMADHQTTGGYPRIAHVIAADIPTLAQKNSKEIIQFHFVSIEQAEEIYLKQQKYLNQMAMVCIEKFKER